MPGEETKSRPSIPREYYKLAEAADHLGCTQNDLVHLGATGKISFKVRLRKWQMLVRQQPEGSGNKRPPKKEGLGSKYQLVTVLQRYMQQIENDGFFMLERAPFPADGESYQPRDAQIETGILHGLERDPASGEYVGKRFGRDNLFIEAAELNRFLSSLAQKTEGTTALEGKSTPQFVGPASIESPHSGGTRAHAPPEQVSIEPPPIGEREKESLLATIGALATVFFENRHGKRDERPRINQSAIVDAVLKRIGKVNGLSKSSIQQRIKDGLAALERRRN